MMNLASIISIIVFEFYLSLIFKWEIIGLVQYVFFININYCILNENILTENLIDQQSSLI